MIAEIMLGLVSIALIGGFILYVRESNKEKAKLTNALIAKTNSDYINSTLADQTELRQPQEPQINEIPIEDLNDDAWYKAVTGETTDEELTN